MSGGRSRKQYIENSYYHIFNRGVEKKVIFHDQQDCNVFLSYLKEYLLPKDEEALNKELTNPNISCKEKDRILKLLRLNNFAEDVQLIAYCLMPNHFHLCIHQQKASAIDKFMNSLATRYTQYFNRKYKRVGPLCQGVYKAVLVQDESQLLYLSKYIHQQALATPGQAWEAGDRPSSYPEYVGLKKTEWIHPEEILKYFSHNYLLTYEAFVKETEDIDIMEASILLED